MSFQKIRSTTPFFTLLLPFTSALPVHPWPAMIAPINLGSPMEPANPQIREVKQLSARPITWIFSAHKSVGVKAVWRSNWLETRKGWLEYQNRVVWFVLHHLCVAKASVLDSWRVRQIQVKVSTFWSRNSTARESESKAPSRWSNVFAINLQVWHASIDSPGPYQIIQWTV